MRVRRSICCWEWSIVILAWSCTTVGAQEPSQLPGSSLSLLPAQVSADSPGLADFEVPDQFSLDQLLNLAEANNPSLRSAIEGIEVARGVHTQVGLYPNPSIGYMANQVFDKNTPGQQGGWIGQVFVTGHKLDWNRQIASRDIEQSQWFYEQQQLRVTNTVRMRYFEILAMQRQVALTEELLQTAERMAASSQQLQKAGEGTRTDVLQAEIEVEQTQILLNNARNQYITAWKRMTSVLGTPLLDPVPVSGNLDDELPNFDWDSVLTDLQMRSPELSAAHTAVNRARAAIQRARVEPIPNFDVQLSGQRDLGAHENIMNAQVGILLPVWNRNQGGLYAASANLRRREAEVERIELALRDRLAQAFQRYQNARQQVERYRTQIIPKAEEVLKLVNTGYRQGELSFLQVLVAQRTYFQTRLAYLNSLTEVWKSTVALSGLLITEDTTTDTIPQPMLPAGVEQ